ncbi:MAG: ABC transporter ATP-binding protein [Nitrosomonas sp.]|jgi:lipopolysaccharide transport system ATP-binding protein|nr:ABC transporter ATP-binding protein [Nitrosomonas sp.]
MSSELQQEVAIRVNNLSKCYQIYDKPNDRLKQFVVPKVLGVLGQHSKPYFREFWALKDISFEIKKGETVGIIGRNGSGKSTLLQIICGTLHPTAGDIEVNGRVAALLELGSGFNPEFTGRENVYLNAGVLGLSVEQTAARFAVIEAFADIGEFIDQPVKTYSSGMMVRLAFAVIAHVDADILIIDEALAVGDAFFTQKCMRFLHKFMISGTVLFVSHDTSAVVNLCNKGILLCKGELIEEGSPKIVIEHYLESLYELTQVIDGAAQPSVSKTNIPEPEEYRDMRQSIINSSILRNDVEVFRFDSEQAGFGAGDAKIVSVRLLDKDDVPLSWIVGGEDVILEICCAIYKDMMRPIVGFHFKNRLGQDVFVDNTYLAYQHKKVRLDAGSELISRFEFRFPILPSGDYSVSPAIAEGSQEEHVQHHWMHDALIVRVHASSVCMGMIGVPMKNISMEKK